MRDLKGTLIHNRRSERETLQGRTALNTGRVPAGATVAVVGGTTTTAGLPPPTHNVAFPQVNLVAEERTIKGSYVRTCVPMRDVPRYIALYRQGRLPVDRLLTGRLSLDEINEGFNRLHEGKAIRQVVVF